jgi:hypothetical protein
MTKEALLGDILFREAMAYKQAREEAIKRKLETVKGKKCQKV